MPAASQDASIANDLAQRISAIGVADGLAAVGFTSAEVLQPALELLTSRKKAGLAAEMQFTYRNPERSTDPARALPGAESIVVGALAYGSASTPQAGQARVARYAVDNQYAQLRSTLEKMANTIRDDGFKARVHMDDNNLVDRNVAWRAGIGWFGKNANLLVPGVGSWVVLGNVITDAPLPVADEPMADGCGPCRRCIDGCPTKAIVGPGIVDARRCIAWLVQGPEPIPEQYREAVGDRIYGCDECQDVCPESPIVDSSSQSKSLEVLWLLEASDEELLARVGHWYIANRDPNVVRRTALVVLGNTADGTDAKVRETLSRYISSSVAQLADHATWAAKQLQCEGLGS